MLSIAVELDKPTKILPKIPHSPKDIEGNHAFLTKALAFGIAKDEMKHVQLLAHRHTIVFKTDTTTYSCIGLLASSFSLTVLKSNNFQIIIL
jgi:hypothetical protein